MYQFETAGKPNIPISTIKNRRSNAARAINRFTNSGVKFILDLSFAKNQMLKMFTNTPVNDTLWEKDNIKTKCVTISNI